MNPNNKYNSNSNPYQQIQESKLELIKDPVDQFKIIESEKHTF